MTGIHRFLAAIVVVSVAAPAVAQDSHSIGALVQQALRESRQAVFNAAQAGRNEARAAAQAARERERQQRDDARSGPEVTETFSKTVRLGRDGTFSLENVAGEITVTGGGGNDVRIDAVKRVRHPNESEARAILQELTIDVSERSGSVDVRTQYPRRRNWNGRVDYTVAVPREATVILKSVSGNVKVTNVTGELRAESVSGTIETTAVRTVRTLRSISGDVRVSD